jgi:hypothetical protein
MESERLAEGWQIEGTQDPLWRYREIILLSLRGEMEEAKAKLKLAQNEYCRYEDEMASRFREFEQRVLSRFSSNRRNW